MAKLVFIMMPEAGHLNATFKLARGLKARGHRVFYLAIPDFEKNVLSNGFEFIPLFDDLFPEGFFQLKTEHQNLEMLAVVQLLVDAKVQRSGKTTAALLGSKIVEVAATLRPDLFIVDTLLPDISMIVTATGIRAVLLNTNFYNPLNDTDTEAYAPLHRLPELILCPQEFDFPRAGSNANPLFYMEASIDVERDEAQFPWERIHKTKQLCYCCLGSQSRLFKDNSLFLQMVLDAFALRPDWQLVMSVGAHLRSGDFHSVPSNAVIVPSAPQLNILKRASLMITHGGLNSIKECIFFGVPMIVFPLIREQPMNAARVEYHGLGIRGDVRETSAGQIGVLVDRISTDWSVRRRVESMRDRFVKLEESGRGSRFIESFLSR